MEQVQSQQALNHYTRAYQQLYQRSPKELRMLADGSVSVNGARMRVAELEYLTQQLEFEYTQQALERRSVIQRLVSWFTKH